MITLDDVKKLIQPWINRTKLMIGHATLRLIDDSGELRVIQAEALQGELLRLQMIQHFGFYSRPPLDADIIFNALGGSRNQAVAVAVDHRQHRPRDLADGESIMKDAFGKFLHFKDDGTAHFKAPRLVIDVDELVILAGQRYRLDVNGFAEELRAEGDSYRRETWQIGAIVLPPVANDIEPPRTEAP